MSIAETCCIFGCVGGYLLLWSVAVFGETDKQRLKRESRELDVKIKHAKLNELQRQEKSQMMYVPPEEDKKKN